MSNKIRILCVDDERNVLRALERLFLDDDYEILTASSGEEGLLLLNAAPQVQVVISDFRMPGMNGVDFLKRVFETHPDTIRIVLSGYADTAAVVAAINEGKIYKFIPKPWNDDELMLTVSKALETFAVRRRNLQLAEELRLKNEELRALNAKLERRVEERTSELVLQNRALLHERTVLDRLPVGVLGFGTDGVVQQINREAATLLGLKAHEILGKSICDALPAEILRLAWVDPDSDCDCREVVIYGIKLQIKGITVIEEDQASITLTFMRSKLCHKAGLGQENASDEGETV
jgi:two-component system NtrC family sensor kinase